METALGAIGLLPVTVGLLHFADRFYNTYKDADKQQNKNLLRFDIESDQFSKWVKASGFTGWEATMQEAESQNSQLAEDLRQKYALACRIIWHIVLALQEAADLLAPPETSSERPTTGKPSTNAKRLGILGRGSSILNGYLIPDSIIKRRSSSTLVNSGDSSNPLSQTPNPNPTAGKFLECLDRLKNNSRGGSRVTITELEALLRTESENLKISDSCDRLSKKVKLREAFASLSESKLTQILQELERGNQNLWNLERSVDSVNAGTATGW